MSTVKLLELKSNLFNDNWDTSLKAADLLAKSNTNETIAILIEGLNSENNFIRNASALGIRNTNNQFAFNALWIRIMELGPNEEIGTLVYALEMADCSNYLIELLDLFFNSNFEVSHSVKTIIEQQIFYLNDDEYIKVYELLNSKKLTINQMGIKYKRKNEA